MVSETVRNKALFPQLLRRNHGLFLRLYWMPGTCVKASAYFSADQVGAGSVEVLLDMIEGNEPEMETAVDAVVVTPENYKEEMGSYAE